MNIMRINKSWGSIVLAIWLILTGLMLLTNIAIPPVLMGVLAIAAGVLILLSR
jgi:hypothetical protein